MAGRLSQTGLLTLSADERGRQRWKATSGQSVHEPEMPLGDGALAVAYQKVEDGRIVLLHTEVPQEPSPALGMDRGWRMAFSKRCDATGKE